MSGRIFDADNHYYEPLDCFSRHIDPKYADRCVRYVDDADGGHYLIGDRLYTYGAYYTDTCPKAGSLVEYLRGFKKGANSLTSLADEPMPAAYGDRDARLALLDEQGIETVIMLPTFAVTVEHFMREDPELTMANVTSFNKWVEEDWGFARDERILSTAMMSLIDRDLAVAELDRILAQGARIIHLLAGPQAGRSPADPFFDPFWARVEEAGAVVAFHTGETGYNEMFSVAWGEEPNPTAFTQSAFQWMNFFGDRPIMETLTSLVFMNLFGRFPGLRVASVEYGSIWVRYLLDSIDKKRGMGRNGPWPGGPLTDRPSEIFREHVYVAPFPEDDVGLLIDLIGPERILCGSDFPHAEGLAVPAEFAELLDGQTDEVYRLVMRENGRRLVGLE